MGERPGGRRERTEDRPVVEGAPGGRVERAAAWAATPSRRSSSCPTRAPRLAAARRPVCPRSRSSELVPADHRRAEPPELAEVSERDLVGALHPAQPPAVLRRPRGLPAGLVHDEVQPQGLRRRGGAARPGRRAPGGAARAASRAGSRSWSSSRRRCARSPAWPPPPCSRRPGRRASSPGCCSCGPGTRRGASARHKVIIPDSAHGTNPASVDPRRATRW